MCYLYEELCWGLGWQSSFYPSRHRSQNSGKLMLVETSVSSWLLLHGQSHFWIENFVIFLNAFVKRLRYWNGQESNSLLAALEEAAVNRGLNLLFSILVGCFDVIIGLDLGLNFGTVVLKVSQNSDQCLMFYSKDWFFWPEWMLVLVWGQFWHKLTQFWKIKVQDSIFLLDSGDYTEMGGGWCR